MRYVLSAFACLALVAACTSIEATTPETDARAPGDAAAPRPDSQPADAAGALERILGASCLYSDQGLCTGYVIPSRGALANRDGKATSESILFSAANLCEAFLGTWQQMPCATEALKGSCEIDGEGLVEFYAASGTRTVSALQDACGARGGVWRS